MALEHESKYDCKIVKDKIIIQINNKSYPDLNDNFFIIGSIYFSTKLIDESY